MFLIPLLIIFKIAHKQNLTSMKTQNLKSRTTRDSYSMRINLVENELSSMLSKLHSYQCEPCTSDMYEQYIELNNDGRVLKQTLEHIKKLFQGSVRVPINITEEVNNFMKAYRSFQESLTLYFTEAVLHH